MSTTALTSDEIRFARMELRHWMIAQRLRFESGTLSAQELAILRSGGDDWYQPINQDEVALAIHTPAHEMNPAVEDWWNAKRITDRYLTVSELRALEPRILARLMAAGGVPERDPATRPKIGADGRAIY